jgi:Domain of unknown function (DUF4129)
VLALGVVGNEIWVGRGWRGWGRRGPRSAEGRADPGDAADGVRLDWAGVQSAPVAQRLGLLLELVIRRLNEVGGVRLSRGLTARELLAAAPALDESGRVRLGVLVRAAEKVRYSDGAVTEMEVADVMEEGRRLLEGIGVIGVSPVVLGAGLRADAAASGRGVGA